MKKLYPTPQASVGTNDLNWRATDGRKKPNKLGWAVKEQEAPPKKLWPTPSACGNHNRKGASPTSGDGLAAETPPSSSQQDFLASQLPLPGSAEAQRMTAGSGLNCLELYSLQNQHGASLRMCVACLLSKKDWYSTIVYLTWKPLVTNTRRLLFQLVPSTPPSIGETEYGLFATPSTSEGTGAQENTGRTGGKSLREQAARMWPTPSARDFRSDRSTDGWKDKRMADPKGKPLPMMVMESAGRPESGQLNPDWVENLMGYPLGWTNLDCQKSASQYLDELNALNNSEMQSSPKSSSKSGGR